jgi:hypothetical protein
MTLNEFKTAASETLSNFFDVLFLQVPWGEAPMHYVIRSVTIYCLAFGLYMDVQEAKNKHRRSKNARV